MKRCLLVFIITLVLPGLAICAPEAFKLEPVAEGFNGDMLGGAYGMAIMSFSPFDKEPAYPSAAKYGSLQLGRKMLSFVIYSSTGSLKPNTIIIDANQNLNLTDDEVIMFPDGEKLKSVSLTMDDGRKAKYKLRLFQIGSGSFRLIPGEWYRGSIDLGGKMYDAVLLDVNLNGLETTALDMLLIDENGNGKFEFNTKNYEFEGYAPLAETVAFLGGIWDLTLDATAPSVLLRRSSKPCGAIRLAVPDKLKECSVFGYLKKDNMKMPLYFSASRPSVTMHVLAGDYIKLGFWLTDDKNDKRTLVMLECAEGTRIEADKTHILKLSNLGGMQVVVEQRGRYLTVSKEMTAQGDLSLSSFMTWDKKGELQSAPTPVCTIYSNTSKGAKKLASGKLEYG
jgi:hypothetical protein